MDGSVVGAAMEWTEPSPVVRVLGAVSLAVGGRPVALGGPLPRRLLAVLLASRGGVVSVDRLVEVLWGDDPPETAVGSLRTYVSRLRRALPPSVVLETAAPGYRLRVEAGAADVDRFEATLNEARSQVRASPEAALALLDEGLDLWGGDAFAEFGGESWARGEAGRLEELRQHAREIQAEALLEMGRAEAAVSEARAITAEQPSRERAWRILILGLHGAGRQGDALRCAGEYRAWLRDELGLDPSAEFTALERDVAVGARHLRTFGHSSRLEPPKSDDGMTGGSSPRTVALPAQQRGCPPELPAALSVALTSDFPLTGRSEALDLLTHVTLRSQSGQRVSTAISGEPGVGKTRLAAELARRWRDAGGAVVLGRCDDEALRPYQPLAELVRPLLQMVGPAQVSGHVGACGAVLGRISPEATSLLGEDPAGVAATERNLLVTAFEDLVGRAAGTWPLMVVLEDLHWADAPTVAALRRLVAEPAGAVAVVVVFRDTDTPSAHPLGALIADLARRADCPILRLTGLSVDAVTDLVRSAGASVDPQRLARDTAGNPLYVQQVLRSLAEGTAGRADALATTIAFRVSALPEPVRDLLAVAGVAGEEFSLPVLEASGPLDGDELLDAAEHAARVGLVAEVPGEPERYRFVHAVVRDVVVAQLGAARRRRLHDRLADALARTGGPHALLEEAWHRCESAGAGHLLPALETARRAGEQAIEQLGFEHTLSVTERALELVGPRPDGEHQVAMGWLLLVRNEAAFRLGNLWLAAQPLAQLGDLEAALADPPLMSELVTRLNWAGSRRLPELADRAAGTLQGTPHEPRAAAFRLQYRARHLQEPGLAADADRVALRARMASDPRALAAALVAQVLTRAERPVPPDVELLDEAEQLLLSLTPTPLRDLGDVLLQRSLAHIRAGNVDAARVDHERLRTLADRHGMGHLRSICSYHDIAWAMASGDLRKARALLHHYSTAGPDHRTRWLRLMLATVEYGEYDDESALAMQEEIASIPHFHRGVMAWRAEQLSEIGAHDQALTLIEHLTRDDLAALPRNFMLFQVVLPLARAMGNLGTSTAASPLLELLTPWRGHAHARVQHSWEGAYESAEGILLLVLDRPDEAVDRLRGGLTLEERLEAKLLASRSRFWLGNALDAAGDHEAAAATWSEALTAAASMGARGLHQRLLLRTGDVTGTV